MFTVKYVEARSLWDMAGHTVERWLNVSLNSEQATDKLKTNN